jgi:leucyl aminopeptidase
MPISLSMAPIATVEADTLVLPAWEEGYPPLAEEANGRVGGALNRLREAGDVSGKANELTPLLDREGLATRRIVVVGLGKREAADRRSLTKAAVAAAKSLCGKKRARLALALPEKIGPLTWTDMALAFGTGAYQGARSSGIRHTTPTRFAPDDIVLVAPADAPKEELTAAVRRADCEARAVQLARDLVNEPPCDLYPETFARRAQEVSKAAGLECTVLDEKRIAEERMGCLLGVAQGSMRPPRVVVLSHKRGGSGPTLGLVGKGVTFDSGGLSLKTTEQMVDMKCDMAGAASVLACMQAIAELKVPVNAIGVLALVENMPSGIALKLGDVLKARNGKTAEILNTDAEGRLILADALTYAVDQKANHLVDLATLTGACMVALGTDVAGLMSNNDPWATRVTEAMRSAGERVWQLPMYADYNELIKSPVADIKNVGGKYAGAITAAKFLENFVGETPWAHLDIAGPAWSMDENATKDVGGTGNHVRGLVQLAMRYAMG